MDGDFIFGQDPYSLDSTAVFCTTSPYTMPLSEFVKEKNIKALISLSLLAHFLILNICFLQGTEPGANRDTDL